jgi:hypothetical protein
VAGLADERQARVAHEFEQIRDRPCDGTQIAGHSPRRPEHVGDPRGEGRFAGCGTLRWSTHVGTLAPFEVRDLLMFVAVRGA